MQELAFEARAQHVLLQKDALLKSQRGGVARENCEATRALEAIERLVSLLFFPTVLGLMNFVWGTFHGVLQRCHCWSLGSGFVSSVVS